MFLFSEHYEMLPLNCEPFLKSKLLPECWSHLIVDSDCVRELVDVYKLVEVVLAIQKGRSLRLSIRVELKAGLDTGLRQSNSGQSGIRKGYAKTLKHWLQTKRWSMIKSNQLLN